MIKRARLPSTLSVSIRASNGRGAGPALKNHLRAAHRLVRSRLRELSVALVDDKTMRRLHGQYLGDRSSTDVLTFPLDVDLRGRPIGGEVVICVPYARKIARKMGTTFDKEVLLYAVHGLLHLSGFDDRTAAQFRRMHRMEDAILRRLGIGPVFDPGGTTMTMSLWLAICAVMLATVLSLTFSTLTYSLRDFSRTKLEHYLQQHGKARWYEKTVAQHQDLIFVTAIGRLLANILILVGVIHLLSQFMQVEWLKYLMAIIVTGLITLFSSVAVPHALASHAAERFIGSHVKFLHVLRMALLPATRVMHSIDRTVAQLFGVRENSTPEQVEEQVQLDILSVVEEGEKEGVVDEQEREMIESVIQFRDTNVGQVMTARPDVIALPINSTLPQVKQVLEESGHSRIPVYEESLDQIVGILYARDLLKHLGLPPEQFDIRTAMRSAFYVPETKPLRDLLQDFRLQKVHMAIVLDEYGGTAGLVSIEDVLEELVGDISDEHEGHEPAMIKRIDDNTFEADARLSLEELNRNLHVNLPEDSSYETLGGFISTTMGRVPQPGARYEHSGMRFIILQAEPQRVIRVRIEMVPQPAEEQPRA